MSIRGTGAGVTPPAAAESAAPSRDVESTALLHTHISGEDGSESEPLSARSVSVVPSEEKANELAEKIVELLSADGTILTLGKVMLVKVVEDGLERVVEIVLKNDIFTRIDSDQAQELLGAAFLTAVIKNQVGIVKMILSQDGFVELLPESGPYSLKSAFAIAALEGRVSMLQVLLTQKIDAPEESISAVISDGRPEVRDAILSCEALVKLLPEEGANSIGSVLANAVVCNDSSAVKSLLGRDDLVACLPKEGRYSLGAALSVAAMRGADEIVSYIVSRKDLVEMIPKDGVFPLQIVLFSAIKAGKDSTEGVILSQEYIGEYIPEDGPYSLMSIIASAAWSGHASTIRAILSNEALIKRFPVTASLSLGIAKKAAVSNGHEGVAGMIQSFLDRTSGGGGEG